MSKLNNLKMAAAISLPLICVGGIVTTVAVGRHDMAIEDEIDRVGCIHLQNGTNPINEQRALRRKIFIELGQKDHSVTGTPKIVLRPLLYGRDIPLAISHCRDYYEIIVDTGCAAKSILQIAADGHAAALPPNYLPEAKLVDAKEIQTCDEGTKGEK